MSQNRGKGKKFHPVERNNFAFDQYVRFLDGIDQKLRKCKKKKMLLLRATTFIKHKIHNFDF